MQGIFRDCLQNVPVLDDLPPFVKSKNVDSSPIHVFARWPFLATVKDDEISFGYSPYESNGLSGILSRHTFEVFDKGSSPVSDMGIVLLVTVANIFLDSLCRFALVEHQFIKSHSV